MNSDLRALYEEVILDHNKNPRNFNKIPEGSNHSAHGDNPLCGDHYAVHLKVRDDLIEDVGFEGAGCAISKASTSIMLESLRGKTTTEANELFEKIHDLFTEEREVDHEDLGKIEVLAGVKEFPMRVKCATLSWHIMKAALSQEGETVTTE